MEEKCRDLKKRKIRSVKIQSFEPMRVVMGLNANQDI
jgi:hypothetical protein